MPVHRMQRQCGSPNIPMNFSSIHIFSYNFTVLIPYFLFGLVLRCAAIYSYILFFFGHEHEQEPDDIWCVTWHVLPIWEYAWMMGTKDHLAKFIRHWHHLMVSLSSPSRYRVHWHCGDLLLSMCCSAPANRIKIIKKWYVKLREHKSRVTSCKTFLRVNHLSDVATSMGERKRER